MKRVGLCARRRLLPTAAVTKTFKTPAPEPEPASDEATLEDDSRRIRRRSGHFQPAQGETDFDGQPWTQAKIANIMMQAKVDVTNYYMTTSTDTRLADKVAARRGALIQVVPMKRYAGVDVVDVPVPLVPNGGNKLGVYHELIPIINRAMKNGQDQVNLATASIAEALYTLGQMNLGPRQHAAAGPRLSDVTDYTEPPTPTTTLQPIIHAEARSPQKRIARLTSPIKRSMRLLTNSVFKLVPGSSPKASPSPTKSDSAPSTPIQQSPNPAKPAITPSGIDSTPLSQSATFDSLFDESFEHTTPQRRPIAPTPSRWNRREPTTPQASTPVPATPTQTDSPIGLAALLPPTPQLPQGAFTPRSAEPASFDFGTVSPSFNSSISWMNSSVQASEPKRIKTVNQARRRQSEPLLRKYFKDKARRSSSSPQKVRFQGQDIFRDDISIGSFFDSAISTPLKSAPTNVDPAGLSVVEEVTEPEATALEATMPAIDTTSSAPTDEDVEITTEQLVEEDVTVELVQADPEAANKAEQAPTDVHHGHTATIEHGVVNIDMRQNPDIFGTHVSSPPAPVYSLSRMADDGCQGHAKVAVTEQNGKLVVRFKLSAEYTHIFPASQGFDESNFTTSPFAISSSPRIAFNTPRLPTPHEPALPPASVNTPMFRTPELPAYDNTLLFGSPLNGLSPSRNTDIGGTPAMNSLLKTPDVTGLGIISGTKQTPGFETPDLSAQATPKVTGADETLVMSWDDLPATTPSQKTKLTTPMQATTSQQTKLTTPMQTTANDTLVMAWDELPVATPSQKATPSPAATPKTSFTPVNQPTPKIRVTEASDIETSPTETAPVETIPAETTPTENLTQVIDTPETTTAPNNTTPAQEAAPAQAADTHRQDYDSPGREYMREFIKRSRQTTTTETGSPVAPTAKRQPLEARSPNRGSPQKNKRKHDDDSGEVQSPAKKAKTGKDDTKQTTPKRARRTKTTRQKTEVETEVTDVTPAVEETTAQVTEAVEKQTEEAEAEEGPVTRRSTRLRSQKQSSGAPKSSIPTPIKLTRSGAGRNGGTVLNSSVRSEQQDLTHQTRLNTKKNKGGAEYPAQVLAKHAETKCEDGSDASRASDESSGGKGKKSVGWREPLESVQEEEGKAKKGRPAKGKATQGKTGVAKPKATAQKKRATKAADLGMAGNGTPVKPQRMTRARTRSQA
ncbi:hypothetical protein ACHAPT_009189 [Fusarium lateritium]